jgi:CO/xanthine dehydrogenase FAD-binding subunit
VGARRTRLAPDELLTAVRIPAPASTLRSAFFKLGARRYLVISIAMVAAALDVSEGIVRDARIAVGACSAAARRLPSAERRLTGERARAGLADRIVPGDLDDLAPIDDVRASADYRRDAALTLTRRAVEACLRGEAGGVV